MNIRVTLSSFWKRYKERIANFFKRFGLIILICVSIAVVFSQLNIESQNTDKKKNVYNPTKTIISGSDIKQEEYKKEENLVKAFVNYCNNQQINDAYNLLTDECKEKLYPDLDNFTKDYYNVIFEKNRECNIQSWVSDRNYNTYKVTFIEDIMSTGNYDDVEKFEDYITIITKDNEQKLNINSYIRTEEINKTTKTDELEVTVKYADIYMSYVKYKLEISNLSENIILLDTSKNNSNIKLLGSNNVEYGLNNINLSSIDLILNGNRKNKKIELKFNKQYETESKGNKIYFKKVILNEDEYLKNKNNYEGYKELIIKLY